MDTKHREWTAGSQEAANLGAVRDQILDCLIATRGGSLEEQSAYLDEVLSRAGATDQVTWGDLYRTLNLLQEDALKEGVDPQVVRAHSVQLQRILEQVDD